MFSQFESGGASGSDGCGDEEEGADHQDDEDEDGDGDGDALLCYIGIVAGEEIPCERSPTNIPQRQVAGETYPQRQVAGESRKLSLGMRLNVVVDKDKTGMIRRAMDTTCSGYDLFNSSF
nr:hypothetical protein [Tanacetum cinerariifolium]